MVVSICLRFVVSEVRWFEFSCFRVGCDFCGGYGCLFGTAVIRFLVAGVLCGCLC